jgi:hypothetical protein
MELAPIGINVGVKKKVISLGTWEVWSIIFPKVLGWTVSVGIRNTKVLGEERTHVQDS